MEKYDFFYSGQIRRFSIQMIKAFSGFQWQTGTNPPVTKPVPCRWATKDRQALAISQNNSENTLLTVPLITIEIKGVTQNRSRTQVPGFSKEISVLERRIDPATGKYTSEVGNSYTVELPIPHPLDVTFEVNIWTSNENQKHQIFEQVYMIFNAGFDIQNSDNALDWTALTTAMLGDIDWSSRSLPVGTDDQIDVTSIEFMLPMYIQPPVKVHKQTIVHQITANVHHVNDPEDVQVPDEDGYDKLLGLGTAVSSTQIITPNNYKIQVDGEEITLLTAKGLTHHDDGTLCDWHSLLDLYGDILPITQLRLKTTTDPEDFDTDIIGTIMFDPIRKNVILWQIDAQTLPNNTLMPIDKIIAPHEQFPGNKLPLPALNQRYLILDEIGANSDAWGSLTASENDIIEWNGMTWTVVFDASATTSIEYIVNLATMKQLKWTGSNWQLAIDGVYNPGYWRIFYFGY